MSLATDFERAMQDIYRHALAIGYKPMLLLDTIARLGGVGAAKQLTLKMTDGFTRLYELKRLDLTVEALMLQSQWTPLFADEELDRARRRLKDVGYEP